MAAHGALQLYSVLERGLCPKSGLQHPNDTKIQ